MKKFRFAVSAPDVGSLKEWQHAVRHLEDAGFDTVVVADYFTEGWTLEPMIALTAAAEKIPVVNRFRRISKGPIDPSAWKMVSLRDMAS